MCIAALSAAGVFVFNYFLTGQFQFHSVEFKGYVGNLPIADAAWRALLDFIDLIRQIALGQPAGSPIRATFATPFLGALLAWIGVLAFDWHTRGLRFAGWLLGCLLGLLSVASGGWQGMNFDRYLAWLLPTGFVFVSCGIMKVSSDTKINMCWVAVAALVIAFQCLGTAAAFCYFVGASRITQLDYETVASMNDAIADKDGGVGGPDVVGSAYLLDGRKIFHLSGFYSPAFRSRNIVCNLEVLSHEPENRFTYWLSNSPKPMLGNWDATPIMSEQVFQGLNKFSLWKSDWTLPDAALKPVSTNAPIARLTLADSIDVGYLKDEKRTEFAVNYRLPGLSYLAFAMDGECDSTRLVDVGVPSSAGRTCAYGSNPVRTPSRSRGWRPRRRVSGRTGMRRRRRWP